MTTSLGDIEATRQDVPRPRPLVGILLFDGVEVLDFAGPFEVFSGTAAS